MIATFSLLLCAVCAVEPQKEQTERVFESVGYGEIYVLTISEKDVKGTPEWREDQADPPWSARKAMKLATDKAAKITGGRAPSRLGWRLTSMSLETLGGRWFWLATFTTPETETTRSCELKLVVLMDGTVVEPEIKQPPPPANDPSA